MDEVIGREGVLYIWECPRCDHSNREEYLDKEGSIEMCFKCGERIFVKL